MDNTNQDLLKEFEKLISQQSQDNEQLQDTLRQLEEGIKSIQESDYDTYGHYKYVIADRYLAYPYLNDTEKAKYQEQVQKFTKEQILYTQKQMKQMNELIVQVNQEKQIIDKNKKVFLILGNTGTGKSSFVQILTKNLNAEIGHKIQSHTKLCNYFENNEGLKFIDTPGINDTKKEREEILLEIARYLHQNNYQPENIFIIYIQNKDLKISRKNIQYFSYTYFLYEIFKEEINSLEVKQFIEEYDQSKGLLNWSECLYHQKKDQFSEKRDKIFQEKDKALNYFQQFNSFHIVVKTFFDQNSVPNLKEYDEHMIAYLKEQIWSNKTANLDQLYCYKDDIQSQEQSLFKKIDQIIQLEENNFNLDFKYQRQDILLIGNSQVGKSSLIEQLTKLKGIRGSGEQSETTTCQFYSIQFENVIYRFIDTPGLEGNETNQDPFHSLKIIADFLRRNKIIEFKILYMIDGDKDVRDGIKKVLKQLIIFIEDIFDRDASYIDNDYLKFLLNLNSFNWKQKFKSIKGKVLKINRKFAQENYSFEEIYYDDELKILNVKFQSNYFTKRYNQFIEVNKEVDQKQQKTLFQAINQLQYISIDEKIIDKIKYENYIEIIETTSQYEDAYVFIKDRYEKIYFMQEKIVYYSKEENYSELELTRCKDQKSEWMQELESKLFILIGEVHQTKQVKTFITKQINQQNNNTFKLQNDIQRRFLIQKFNPILFESKLLQKIYSYLENNNTFEKYEKHLQILEDLAKIKTLQEIAFLEHIQQKCIDQLYDQKPDDVNSWIEKFISGFNAFFGTGIQIYRYASYFSLASDATKGVVQYAKYFKAAQDIVGSWMNIALAGVCMGIDIYSYSQRYICGNQLKLNTGFNLINILTSIACILWIPYIGWIFGGAAGGITLIGNSISAFIFTSSTTFDQTISFFFKFIIDDMQPNQNLQYFQKSEFLKNKYNIDNYAQLSQKQGYQMFRKLEVQKYNEDEQKKLLLKLFNNPDENNLKDLISQYIVQNYISNKINTEFKPSIRENPITYLNKILNYLNINNQVIDTFYNRYDQKVFKKIKEQQNNVKELIKNKLKSFQINQNIPIDNNNIENIWNDEEEQKVQQYQNSILEFQCEIKKIEYTCDQQIKFGDGSFRKCDRFPILLNSYCNLMQFKTEYLFEQKTISDFSKDSNNKCFKIENEKSFDNFLKKENKKDTNNLKNILQMSDKYISNRYFQKIKGQDNPNLTCLAESELQDCKVDFSLDLHDLADDSKYFNIFIDKVKNRTNLNQIDGDILRRMQDFYESIDFFKNVFN